MSSNNASRSRAATTSNHTIAERTGAHLIAAALKRHGVDCIFGQSIPSALFLVAPEHGIRQIGYRMENAGAAMADAFARISHQIPVVTAQNGPAATLLVPGLAEALKASIPMVAIVQDVNRQQVDKNAFQELDHLELFRGSAKWIKRVSELDRVEDYIDMAFSAAASGRPGPVVLIVPIDLFDEQRSGELARPRTENLGRFPLDRAGANPELVQAAADMIADAKAPLIIAGGGVHVSDACAALAALQENASLPVATTVMGKGAVDEGHPLSVGVVGYFMGTRSRTKHLRNLVSDADVVVLVGNRTNQNGTDSWKLYPKDAKYIHIDIDGQEVGRNYEASIRLVADARLALEALNKALETRNLDKRTAGRAELEQTILQGHKAFEADLEAAVDMDQTPVRPERLMRDLDAVLTPDTVVVSDASYSSVWVANFLKCQKSGMRFVTPRGLAGLGWGLPFALGAKVAQPESPVVCLVGDGGFAHVWGELETARRMNLPVVVIVLNNQILGYQKHSEKLLFNDFSDVTEFEAVDHAKIAQSCGCVGVRIEAPSDFASALKTALAANVSTVIDVVTDERAYPPVTAFEASERLNY